MFAKYTYKAGSSATNLIADIKKILTGTTDKTLLSTDCDQVGSFITDTLTTKAGWTADASVGLNDAVKMTLPANVAWTDVTWNGAIFCAISGTASNPSNVAATSSDGITWTQQTLPSSGTWTSIIWTDSKFVAVGNNLFATSVNGTTWTAGTIPTGNYVGLCYGGTATKILLAWTTASNTIQISTDYGTTWVAKTLSNPVHTIAWNGTLFRTAYLYSQSNTSYDGLIWSSNNTTPYGTSTAYIKAFGSLFVHYTNNAATIFYSYDNGGTWTNVQASNSSVQNVIYNGTTCVITYSSTGRYFLTNPVSEWGTKGVQFIELPYPSDASYQFNTASPTTYVGLINLGSLSNYGIRMSTAATNTTLTSLNNDGTTSKVANISIVGSKLNLVLAESFTATSFSNLAYQTFDGSNSQLCNAATGGVLYIGATKNYICLLSYDIVNTTFGNSTTKTFSGVFEFSRDDPWNTNYPPAIFLTGDKTATAYLPRIKTNSAGDAYFISAYLTMQVPYSLTKQILSSNGTTPANSAIDIRFANTAQYTYTILGGILQGGIKRTTDSIGAMLDETIIASSNYVVLTGGTSAPTLRFLLPKF